MMIEQRIDFLHICETNERDNNFDINKSKAHIKYLTPFNNEFSNSFFIINNPNKEKLGGGSCIIMTERLHNHLESTKIIQQGRYISNVFNFKNKKKFYIHSIYLPNLEPDHQDTYRSVTKSLFETLNQQPNKVGHVTLILGDFNINDLYKIKPSLKNKNLDFLKNCIYHNRQNRDIVQLILQHFDMVHLGEKFNQKQMPTFYHVDITKTPSTIDYIFGSKNLCNQITEFIILDNNNWYTSDHKVVLTSIDHPNANLNKSKKFFNLSRDISNHED
ncbi:unnamed protein product [Rhizophagus irregularis]|nr:unnamed protein product [Rhizophagus irregularis]